jgi:hypothetical protein
MWSAREGTPWEGPAQVQDSLPEWLKWYMWSMRKMYLALGLESSPNGWGMRGEDGDWMFFDSPAILCRTFAGIGNSPLGEEAPWGRAEVRILYLEDVSKGWRDLIKKVLSNAPEAKNTRDLLAWHTPMSQTFYELPDELAAAYLKDAAWMYKAQKGVK